MGFCMCSKDYQLLFNTRKLHPYSRSSICGKPRKGKDQVECSISNEGKTKYDNTYYCESPFTCSRCAKIYSSQRIQDVNHILKWVKENDYRAYFGTTTTPHTIDTRLIDSHRNLKDVYSKVFTGSDWKKIKEKSKFLGTVKSFEVTYSDENGFHPHYHTLFITKIDIDSAFPLTIKAPKEKNGVIQKTPLHAENFQEWVYLKMKKMHEKIGIKAPSKKHAFDFKPWERETGEYMAKFGLSFELTSGSMKTNGKTKPLMDFILRTDKEGVKIAREYINFILAVRPSAMYFNKVLDLASELYVKNSVELFKAHEEDSTGYIRTFKISSLDFSILLDSSLMPEFDMYFRMHTNPHNAWSEFSYFYRDFFSSYVFEKNKKDLLNEN